ncbi:MAG TPA: thioredoxin domain-containing protein [Saprospiraceae bacterium]|nr:thioredoxin domain-containing protein [Saprospiraceae bacterium]HMQ83095.1 thioredoxin domain-containing protein [Saprospiraceae bacterium]
MNHLQHESSPYLLQHAHNPVDWYPWSEAAFERARAEDKPVLVSIGYSTCHWCHVMERESFEDPSMAAFMNENFINIKVDREERPDVDKIYMNACQIISGAGGWPLNCFLTPERKPFFAGTYYPPRPAHNRPSWRQLLEYLSDSFHNRRSEVEKQADRLTQAIEHADEVFFDKTSTISPEQSDFSEQTIGIIVRGLQKSFDTKEGGFGRAPKFPSTLNLRFLLAYTALSGKKDVIDHVWLSLDKMILGGMYDQLGGGFARYSTDNEWLVPHFEKMLYDNALLVGLLAEAYAYSPKALYRETIEETLAFIQREMTSEEGGFYAALDADSEGVEGKFYVWSKEEVDAILGTESTLFCQYFDITESGNWEGANILRRSMPLEVFAESWKLDAAQWRTQLERNKKALLEHRNGRIRPGLDDKCLLSWHALMTTAYIKAYKSLGEERYKVQAARSLDFMLQKFDQGDGVRFFHTYKNGQAKQEAFLDDYAHLIETLLEWYSLSFDLSYLAKAERLIDHVLVEFLDPESNLLYFTTASQSDLVLRPKEIYDSETSSGNATMATVLHQMSLLTGRHAYAERAVGMLEVMESAIARHPRSFGHWSLSMLHYTYPFWEIAVVGADAFAKATALQKNYLPNTLVMASTTSNDDYPLLQGKEVHGDTKIYVCREYACQRPVIEIEEVLEQIRF